MNVTLTARLRILRVATLFAIASSAATAHPLSPALLTLRESAEGRLTATLRTPLPATRGVRIEPVLPGRCHALDPATLRVEEQALAVEASFDCAGGLAGETITASGIDGSVAQLLIHFERDDGSVAEGLLAAHRPRFTVPARSGTVDLLRDQFLLGATHLLGGIDHLLFLAGLALAVRGRRLVLAISAFTAGHAASLSWVVSRNVLPAPALVETAIAATLVALAVSLAAPRECGTRGPERHPALWPFGFGLVHGLGFASSLARVGLPRHALVPALASFHVGIEITQLGLVIAALPLASAFRRHVPGSEALFRGLCTNAIGAVGAWLVLDRAALWIARG